MVHACVCVFSVVPQASKVVAAFEPPVFGVTFIGTSHGFDPKGLSLFLSLFAASDTLRRSDDRLHRVDKRARGAGGPAHADPRIPRREWHPSPPRLEGHPHPLPQRPRLGTSQEDPRGREDRGGNMPIDLRFSWKKAANSFPF